MDNNNAQIIEGHDHIDDLTGLHNLNGILSRLQGHDDYSASDSSVIIYLNVMNFKSFNQRYGFEGAMYSLRALQLRFRTFLKVSFLPEPAETSSSFMLNPSMNKK